MYEEKKDAHPVFLYNPFLIEDDASLVEYEHQIPCGRIDFLFNDKNGVKLFVELEWSGIDKRQILDYVASIKTREEEGKYRIIWLIPDTFEKSVPVYLKSSLAKDNVEIKTYSKEKIIKFIELRKDTQNTIQRIIGLLHKSVNVKIVKESVQFPSAMQACYFDGTVVQDGRRVGLKKTATGWYLDMLNSILNCHFANELPDLTLEVVKELLDAPYYYRYLGRGKGAAYVNEKGFGDFITHSKYSDMTPIVEIVQEIKNLTNEFYSKFVQNKANLYDDDVSKYDLLIRSFDKIIKRSIHGGVVLADKLLTTVIEEFQLRATDPIPKVKHNTVGDILSSVRTSENYENNMGKRIIELYCLKSMLFPSRAIYGTFEVLTPKYIGGREGYERIRTQRFIINNERTMYRSLARR